MTHPQLQYKSMVSLSDTTDHVTLTMAPTEQPIQVPKGTYGGEVCYAVPATSDVKTWQKDVEFSLSDPNNIFSFLPLVGKASLGDDEAVCGSTARRYRGVFPPDLAGNSRRYGVVLFSLHLSLRVTWPCPLQVHWLH